MKQKVSLFLILILSCAFAWGQTRQVSGVLQFDSAELLSGVSISVKGGNAATTTNADGRYTITIPDRNNVTLVYSYIGRRTQEVAVGSNTTVNVTLQQEANTLNDIVVIGYQTV